MLTSEAEIFLNFPMGQKSQHFDFGTPRQINSGMLLDLAECQCCSSKALPLQTPYVSLFIAPLSLPLTLQAGPLLE
jgi:hypothetical protein